MTTPERHELGQTKLSKAEFLIAEYNYLGQAAFQSNEDRARVASFYFVSVGSLVAAILGSAFSGGQDLGLVYWAFSMLFTILTIVGVLTVFQLARLRAAWYSSVLAMNMIKELYIDRFPAMETSILWRELPAKDRWYSVANLLRIQVALLASLTLGATLFTFFRGFHTYTSVPAWILTFALPAGLFSSVFSITIY
jgi:hypothetical protein